MEEFKSLLKEYGNVDNFVEFYKLFCDSAKKFNLTSITDEKEVAIKHFIDSLKGQSLLTKNARVVEIGSGGGFPSVPLKIARPDLDFTLIEATKKKCDYLKDVGLKLNFDRFNVVNGRCEELAHNNVYRECFDFAIARAVAPLNILVEYLLPFVKVGGKVIAYKGSNFNEELDLSKKGVIILGGSFLKTITYDLPQGFGLRSLIVIEKIKSTNCAYPRTEAKIRKSPL